MAGGGNQADGDARFQIAPMIDLILTLLVFFMSSVALKQTENELALLLPGIPPIIGKTTGAKIELMVVIEEDESLSVNGASLATGANRELTALRTLIREQIDLFDNTLPVVICPSPDARHVRIIEVLDACAAEGVKNISFGEKS
ncbi:MAG: biopolymer transporter ExbD [Verrucomicrobiae bacterium]|nr:biopolymer transporter ExbD [Verrucomicrobiae bacterium]